MISTYNEQEVGLPYSCRNVGRVLTSLFEANEPAGGYTTEAVTHAVPV